VRRITAWMVVLLVAAPGCHALAGENLPAKKDPAGFSKIKSLAGEWEGKTSDGKPVRLTYQVASAGTAVVETVSPPGEMDMVTVYHADGDSILMTHYCAANNQPRMRARVASDNPKEIAFSYVDAANLSTPDEGHMSGLTLTFEDASHLSQAWTWTGQGGGKPEVFRFQRKK
jgi:hypothetical protein